MKKSISNLGEWVVLLVPVVLNHQWQLASSNVPGVAQCHVNFGAEQAAIEYNPRCTSI